MMNFIPAPLNFFEIVFRQHNVVVNPHLIACCEVFQDKIQKSKSPSEILENIYKSFKHLNNSKVLFDISIYHMRLNGFNETDKLNRPFVKSIKNIDSFNQLLELVEVAFSINQNNYLDYSTQANV